MMRVAAKSCRRWTVSRADAGRAWQRLVPWVVLAFVIGGSISWIRRPGDFAGYLTVGELILSGSNIYAGAPPGVNTWPPFFSLLCVPLALLARPTPFLARGVWLALNFAVLWWILKILTRMVYGCPLHLRSGQPGLWLGDWEIFVPVLLCSRFILGNFDHLQVNILIFGCALAGLYWYTRGHDVPGGIALGLAAALKVMPAVFVPYFLYRRRYRVALASAVATIALSLSPVLLYGWSGFVGDVASWRATVHLGWGVGKMNQSVYAMFDRFLGHGITPFNATAVTFIPESGSCMVLAVTGAALIVVTVAALLFFRGSEPAESPASLAEYSIVFVVSALFGPLAWKAYLVVLLCPCMVLIGAMRRRWLGEADRHRIRVGLALYFVLAGLTTPGLLGKDLAGALEMLSVVTIGALILLLTLFWARVRLAGRARATEATGGV